MIAASWIGLRMMGVEGWMITHLFFTRLSMAGDNFCAVTEKSWMMREGYRLGYG